MKRSAALLICFILQYIACWSQKNVQGMIAAEKAFAAHAVQHGTREAFLQFADSMGIQFDKGKQVSARALWRARENRPGILNWHPQFVGIAASNDFGFSTGPWTFQAAKDDTISARGQFSTIWHWTPANGWTFLLDIGNGGLPVTNTQAATVVKPALRPEKDSSQYLTAEKNFIQLYKQSPAAAYGRFLSPSAILNRNHQLPAFREPDYQQRIAQMPAGLTWEILGQGAASSGDMAYVFGAIRLEGKMENYLHVWRKEGNGWKLALEVLRLP